MWKEKLVKYHSLCAIAGIVLMPVVFKVDVSWLSIIWGFSGLAFIGTYPVMALLYIFGCRKTDGISIALSAAGLVWFFLLVVIYMVTTALNDENWVVFNNLLSA